MPATFTSARRHVQPSSADSVTLRITNLVNGDIVHQAALLLTGNCSDFDTSAEDYIAVRCRDSLHSDATMQRWPVSHGTWKAMVILECGVNNLIIEHHHNGGIQRAIELAVTYQPLLQLPPLHLAIMVASDSPLLIDCPPMKYGTISSTHVSLEAAIRKLRMTAYMWQALTAEDLRQKGLGRRSFRLEEVWDRDTVSHIGQQYEVRTRMGSVPKVHVIKTDKTVAKLRDASFARGYANVQQPEKLHQIFTKALKAHGWPFDSGARPVVAGLILDSHLSFDRTLVVGHAALGTHAPGGLSLGVFGSHLTYSWPRFLEEVPGCLLDQRHPGETVANDHGECTTIAQACFAGQGAFLHEVGHAFGAKHTTGIMARGYSKDWGHNFLALHDAMEHEHQAKWDLQDALRFMLLPHFRLPDDERVTADFTSSSITIEAVFKDTENDSDEQDEDINISSAAGIARVVVTSGSGDAAQSTVTNYIQGEPWFSITNRCMAHTINNITSAYPRDKPLSITVLAMNGKLRRLDNVWSLFASSRSIRVPGTSIVLHRKSIRASNLDNVEDGNCWTSPGTENKTRWTVMLAKRVNGTHNGSIIPATSVDLYFGCTLECAVIEYKDGSKAHCGPTDRVYNRGHTHSFGSCSYEQDAKADGFDIEKVEVCKNLSGIQMTLRDGSQWGTLRSMASHDVFTLAPADGEKIVGFYGMSERGRGYCCEFGIITAPGGEVPEIVYDMPEMQNFV